MSKHNQDPKVYKGVALPEELVATQHRSMEPDAVDDRMAWQVSWEDLGRTAPRDRFHQLDEAEKRGIIPDKLKRVLAIGAVAAVSMLLFDRAVDQNNSEHYKLDPTPSGIYGGSNGR